MNKKNMLISAIIFLLLISYGVYSDDTLHMNYDKMYDENEYVNVIKAAEKVCGHIDVSTAYKLYKIDGNFIETLEKNESIDNCLSESYSWIITNSKNEMFKVIKKEDSWRYSGKCVPDKVDSDTDRIIFEDIDKDVLVLKEKGISVNDMRCFEAPMYYSSFVIFYTQDNEYLIPFSFRTDFTNLENGKLYLKNEVADALKRGFADGDSKENGGAAEKTVNGVYILGGIAIIAITLVVCLVIIRQNKKSKTGGRI